MTVADRPAAALRTGPTSVVGEIAARRRADVVAGLGPSDRRAIEAALGTAPPPRSIVDRLAAPGLHLIAEIKRASPSAGRFAAADEDVVARARAYEAGGASAISVLCEPHWFAGSIDDLRAVRAAVAVPVLAKEFVVDEIQLPMLRAAGADLVLLLAVLHPAARLARLVDRALAIGLEPLVEVHDARELERALATGARLIGVNNRDLRTLRVDVERAARLREQVPDDRLAVAESGVRDPATVARWRAIGYDAALVGEALVRAADPAAAVRSFVAAGVQPSDPANVGRRPLVKICGITDAAGVLAAIAAGADAIGLNVVPGTPRELGLDEAASLARLARTAGGARRPLVVAITAEAAVDDLAAIVGAVDPDVVQLNGEEPVAGIRRIPRRAWKVLHIPATEPDDGAGIAASALVRGRAFLDAGVERLMLDTAGGPHPGGTGTRGAERVAAEIARDVPVVLAGGLTPANVGAALRAIPAVGVDVATGVERPRAAGERPTKDPYRVALFTKRARAARDDRPNLAFGPTPVHAGLLEADGAGRWGMERDFGGRYVPETLMAALEQLEAAYADLRHDPVFWAELRELLERFAGRPTPLYRADRLAAAVIAEASTLLDAERRRPGSPDEIPALRLYLKREDLAHTGAHKINNALGQALLTRRLGKSRVIAETGAGQHGVATATACALLDLPCVVYMGAEDIERQGPNVLRMRALGAEVRSVTSGTATLKDAVNEAMRDWVTNVETTHYVLGSAMGPHPYPTIVRDLQRRIGDEAAAQLIATEGRLPTLAVACVGGGSNAIGLLARFIGEPAVRLAVVEAAGDGIETGRHAAAILGGTPGILHGSRSLMLQDPDGQVVEAHSASAGLDYPGIGPQLAALAEGGRIEVLAATDRDAVAAMKATTRTEGILPALETAHAVAALPRLVAQAIGSDARAARAGGVARRVPRSDLLVLVGFSGRGDKDLAALERFAAVEPWASAR
jgi:tryptophan synthase beta subunit